MGRGAGRKLDEELECGVIGEDYTWGNFGPMDRR